MISNKNNYFLLKKPIVLVVLFLLFSFSIVHRYYFSLTEIRVDSQKKTLNVSCKMFTDDLQSTLNKTYHKKIDLATSAKNKEVQDLLTKYISEHLKIIVAGKLLKLTFVGYENEEDATWSYLEVLKYDSKGSITVIDELLFEHFPDQTNIIQFYLDETNQSKKLENPQAEAVFEF